MVFVRNWDSSCPRVWDSWEADGKKWVIQDLPPEDDEEALRILLDHMCADEVLCVHTALKDDPESVRGMGDFWRKYLAKRTSLACYVDDHDRRQLAAVNVCVVMCDGEDPKDEIFGARWKNVYDVLAYVESKVDQFEYLGVDKVLYALGLVVVREFRGAKLGVRMLMAREPLCRHLGIKATGTVFTGVASQKCATRAGFTTIATVNMRELADLGLKYPRDESKEIKMMVKKFE